LNIFKIASAQGYDTSYVQQEDEYEETTRKSNYDKNDYYIKSSRPRMQYGEQEDEYQEYENKQSDYKKRPNYLGQEAAGQKKYAAKSSEYHDKEAVYKKEHYVRPKSKQTIVLMSPRIKRISYLTFLSF
jgi:hypothetical protein